jgi:hypothetical protein
MTKNRYTAIIEKIFQMHYKAGAASFCFERDEIIAAARELEIDLPKNIGDVIYSFRYRTPLPDIILKAASRNRIWVIEPAGKAKYRFSLIREVKLEPNRSLAMTKIPDSTPGIVAKYALSDEQALLARVRYNRLVDIFSGVACYSLQNHLRTSVPDMGQVETDEIYVGVDKKGVQYVFPVQAKGGKDRLSVIQIEQDLGVCAEKFPDLVCRPIAAQFMTNEVIVLFELERDSDGIAISSEKHYKLVPPDKVTSEDLKKYARRSSE